MYWDYYYSISGKLKPCCFINLHAFWVNALILLSLPAVLNPCFQRNHTANQRPGVWDWTLSLDSLSLSLIFCAGAMLRTSVSTVPELDRVGLKRDSSELLLSAVARYCTASLNPAALISSRPCVHMFRVSLFEVTWQDNTPTQTMKHQATPDLSFSVLTDFGIQPWLG